MKDRIGTVIYDTEAAKKIGEYSSDLPASDFGYYKEALYKEQNGEYFLACKVGPQNKYVKYVAGKKISQKSGRIKPLTFSQAKEWYKDFILDENKKETKKIYASEFELKSVNKN